MSVRIDGVMVAIESGVAMWLGGMECDVDGAPRAYAPEGSALVALDALGNAGHAGDWWALACDEHGNPIVQDKDAPAPGYYVSTTALGSHEFAPGDQRRYVDASTVPYLSVSESFCRATGAKLGDLAVCSYRGRSVGAVIADIGPGITEGSIALHKALGVDPQRALPKHKLVGIDSGVSYSVYLGSAATPPWPRGNVSAIALQLAAQRAGSFA